MAFIAFSLSAVDKNLSDFNVDILFCFVTLLTALSSTFIYCYYADKVTSNLVEIGDIFYRSEWYMLSPKIQKLVILPIQIAQRPFRFSGYGIVDCSQAIFGTVKYVCFFGGYLKTIAVINDNNF